MKKKWYNLLVGITLTLPMSIYLILVATVFQVKADYFIYGTIEQVMVVEDDFLYAHALVEDVRFNGNVEWHDGEYALKFTQDDIVKIDKGFYQYKTDYEIKKDEPLFTGWVNVKLFEMKKQQSYKIPLAVVFSLLGVLIAALVISGKMQWQKKKPRLATFLALLTGTLILLVLNTMIGSILGVFGVATASFGLYCIEYLIQNSKITEKDSARAKSELENILQETMRNLK